MHAHTRKHTHTHLQVLLLVVHGDEETGAFGGHVWPDTGQAHLQCVDGSPKLVLILVFIVRKFGTFQCHIPDNGSEWRCSLGVREVWVGLE